MQHQLFLEPKVKGTSSKENEALVKLVKKDVNQDREEEVGKRGWRGPAHSFPIFPTLVATATLIIFYSEKRKGTQVATSAILTNKSMMQRASKIKAIIVPLLNYNFLNDKKE